MGSYSSDVKAKTLAGNGNRELGVGPARIRQIQILSASGGNTVSLTEGSGGTEVLGMTVTDTTLHSVNIPADGILVQDAYFNLGSGITQVVVFYA
jgi:hypothetical protein